MKRTGKSQKVWEKEYVLLEDKEGKSYSEELKIEQTLKLDLKEYNNHVKAFEQYIGMQLKCVMKLKFNVVVQTQIKGEEIKEEYVSNVSLDLGQKTTEILGDLTEQNSEYIMGEDANIENISIVNVIINIVLLIIGILMMRYILTKTVISHNIKNEYKLELNKILRTCQDKIVQVSRKIDVNETEIVEVRDFGEIIKLSEELSKPILCWIDKTKNEAWFCVISSKVTYCYVLSQNHKN